MAGQSQRFSQEETGGEMGAPRQKYALWMASATPKGLRKHKGVE